MSILNTADRLHTIVCDKFKIKKDEKERDKFILRFNGMNSYCYGDS
jgi:hypothetical protein